MSFIEKFGGVTEEYKFYNESVTLRFDKEKHEYFRILDGNFLPVDGVTTICHIINKAEVLVPWAAKVTIEKLLKNTPTCLWEGSIYTKAIPLEEFQTICMQAKSAHKDKIEDAANVGHMAHEWIENYIKDCCLDSKPIPPLPEDARAASCVMAALEWMAKHNIRWIYTERKIYSRLYNYAGTTDGVGIVDSCDDPACCHSEFKDRLAVIDWKSSNYLYTEYIIQTAAYQQALMEELGLDIKDRWIVRLGKEDGEFQTWHCEESEYEHDINLFVNALNLYRGMELLEDRVKYQKEIIKQQKKAQREQEKAEALKVKCKNANKYKGVRYPTCNGGNPCETCLRIYREKHPESN